MVVQRGGEVEAANACAVVRRQLEASKAVDIAYVRLEGDDATSRHAFVASATSDRHMAFIVETVMQGLKASVPGLHVSLHGEGSALWQLVDAEDVVAHVFSPDGREYYDLERMYRARANILAADAIEQVADNAENEVSEAAGRL